MRALSRPARSVGFLRHAIRIVKETDRQIQNNNEWFIQRRWSRGSLYCVVRNALRSRPGGAAGCLPKRDKGYVNTAATNGILKRCELVKSYSGSKRLRAKLEEAFWRQDIDRLGRMGCIKLRSFEPAPGGVRVALLSPTHLSRFVQKKWGGVMGEAYTYRVGQSLCSNRS